MATNQTPFGIPGLWSPSSAGSTRQLPRVSLGTRRMTARHGSGAMDTTTRGRVRAASRENSRESRRRPAPNVASGPVGPATAAEWNDIADGLRERISRAEKAVALHAHTIGQLQTEATQQSNVQPSVVKRVEALAADMDRRFIEGGEKVMQRVNRLEGELKLLYEHVRSFGQATDNGSLPTPIPGVLLTVTPRHRRGRRNRLLDKIRKHLAMTMIMMTMIWDRVQCHNNNSTVHLIIIIIILQVRPLVQIRKTLVLLLNSV